MTWITLLEQTPSSFDCFSQYVYKIYGNCSILPCEQNRNTAGLFALGLFLDIERAFDITSHVIKVIKEASWRHSCE